MQLCGARARHGGRCRRPATKHGRCYKHGGKPNLRQWHNWRPGVAAWREQQALVRALGGKWYGGRPKKAWRGPVPRDRRELVIAVAQEVLARVEEVSLSGRGEADELLGIWKKAAGHVVSMLEMYRPGESDKRDRLIWEIMQGTGNQLLRIGEGLLQREKTDKLAGLLEQLRSDEAAQKKASRREK